MYNKNETKGYPTPCFMQLHLYIYIYIQTPGALLCITGNNKRGSAQVPTSDTRLFASARLMQSVHFTVYS